MEVLEQVVGFLMEYEYLAMFGILVACGLGLPIPEEVTLIGSGILVGLEKADFVWASVACVTGILAGDSIIFGLGYGFGERFLQSRPMRILLSEKRQVKVGRFFSKHGNKAVFFARFVAGVRIGVYAYAGSQRMSWFRFLFLDLLGALISGPTSILLGAWVTRKLGDTPEARERALDIAHEVGIWLLSVLAVALVIWLVVAVVRRRRRARGVVVDVRESAPTDEVPVETTEAASTREPGANP